MIGEQSPPDVDDELSYGSTVMAGEPVEQDSQCVGGRRGYPRSESRPTMIVAMHRGQGQATCIDHRSHTTIKMEVMHTPATGGCHTHRTLRSHHHFLSSISRGASRVAQWLPEVPMATQGLLPELPQEQEGGDEKACMPTARILVASGASSAHTCPCTTAVASVNHNAHA